MQRRFAVILSLSVLATACASAGAESSNTSYQVETTSPTLQPSHHVASLDGSTTNLGSTWTADVTITVFDSTDQPVAGAVVTGSWDQDEDTDASCETDADGECTLTSSPTKKSVKTVTFTISNIHHAVTTYNPVDDIKPDPDSPDTSITVSKT